jgi:hypothetical protein
MYGDSETAMLAEDCQRGHKTSCEQLDAGIKLARAGSGAFLARAASAYCRDIEPNTKIDSVAIRIQEKSALPWSKRNSGMPKTILVDAGVHKFDAAVLGPGLYTKRNKS